MRSWHTFCTLFFMKCILLAYFLHTFFKLYTLFRLIIRFHAQFLQTLWHEVCADKFFALQTFCRKRAHIEQSLHVSFHCSGATGWGPLALSSMAKGQRRRCHGRRRLRLLRPVRPGRSGGGGGRRPRGDEAARGRRGDVAAEPAIGGVAETSGGSSGASRLGGVAAAAGAAAFEGEPAAAAAPAAVLWQPVSAAPASWRSSHLCRRNRL